MRLQCEARLLAQSREHEAAAERLRAELAGRSDGDLRALRYRYMSGITLVN